MITAIDSSVLLCIFKDESDATRCIDAIEKCAAQGSLVICDVVAAETGAHFDEFIAFEDKLVRLGIRYDQIAESTAYVAGRIFRQYREDGGIRNYLIPDFLIGAHAMCQCQRLLAYDRGYMRRYFEKLNVMEP